MRHRPVQTLRRPAQDAHSHPTMRLVSVTRIPTRARLARDVRIGPLGTVPLLRAGAAVEPRYRTRMLQLGVPAVWIDDELSRGIEPLDPLSAPARERVGDAVVKTLGEARSGLAEKQSAISEASLARLRAVAEMIAEEIANCPEAAYALTEMATADSYTHRHSVRVTTLGLLLAARHWARHGWMDHTRKRRFDGIPERLTLLGVGLMVHDIGKLAIPSQVLNKPGRLDASEWELMRRHPDIGVSMLPAAQTSYRVLAVVRQHHERLDGSGYPSALTGEAIHEFAKLCAIADVYDAICSERPYKAAAPPHVGLKIVRDGGGTAFDAAMVDSFCRVVMPYPPGHEIVLPDGRVGIVVDVRPDAPYEPLVRIPFEGGGFDERRVRLDEQAGAQLAA